MSEDISIGVLAYQHEKVLGALLNSIVGQKTKYSYKVIIGVDLCKDKTLEVANTYCKLYPNKITVVERKENIGAVENYFDLLDRLNGRFVMIHDGDDVMLPNKLEKLGDFLSVNPDCAMVGHRLLRACALLKNVNGGRDIYDLPQKFDVGFLVEHMITLSSSQKLYRNPVVKPLYKNTIDFGMDIAHTGSGKIGFINETLGIKRDYPESITKVKGKPLGVLIKASLNGFDSAFPMLNMSARKKAIRTKEKYLVACICDSAFVDDLYNYELWIQYLNTSRRSQYTLFSLLRLFKYMPNFQYALARIIGWAHQQRKNGHNNLIDPEWEVILENYNSLIDQADA